MFMPRLTRFQTRHSQKFFVSFFSKRRVFFSSFLKKEAKNFYSFGPCVPGWRFSLTYRLGLGIFVRRGNNATVRLS
jgi:hypothetical protein